MKAEKLHFLLEGHTVRGYRWNAGAEKKLLILHGFESSVVNFDRYIKPLTQKGYEVLAFDAPAHGRSTGREINVLLYKKMVHHIYEAYGPIDAYLAHSFGGLTVSLFLEEVKHEAGTKLVLIAPAAETSTAIDNFFRFLKLDPGVRSEFDRLIYQLGKHKPEWYSIARAAKHIKAEVLFLQDTEDDMTPIKDVRPIMEQNYPNFRFIISEGLGHRRIYRDHKSQNAIIEFL